MKRAVRRSAKAFAALLLLLGFSLIAGLLVPRPFSDLPAGAGAHEIVLIANPIHTDIALPAEPHVLSRLGFLEDAGLPLDHPDLGTILVGWGGREFYTTTPTWGDLTARAAFASITRDASVLRFALAGAIEPDFPGTRRLILTDAQLDALLLFIAETLERDGEGRPVPIPGAGYTPFDRFYEAEGWFNIALGCNVWTGAALARAGIASGMWTPLPQTLLASIDWHR